MSLKIIVLAKQVPDTKNVGKDAMKEDGTVNRGALDAIYNPEDLHALEQALRIKDEFPDTIITVLTMGPPRASDVLREALYRGVKNGILLTDRKFAGSDTLATSYALSQAIKKISDYDIVIAGRQAIDGDTAQVGPQIAEKLKIPQITYAENIDIKDGKVIVKRRLENGVETVVSKTPVLITVHNSAPSCRVRNARLLMKFKHARSISELQDEDKNYAEKLEKRPYLKIEQYNVEDVKADVEMLGLSGSPTKVKKIESVVFQTKDSKVLNNNDKDIDSLMKELITSHIIG